MSSTTHEGTPARRTHRVAAVVLAAAVIAAGAGIGWWLRQTNHDPQQRWVAAADVACAEHRTATNNIALVETLDDPVDAQRVAGEMVAELETLRGALTNPDDPLPGVVAGIEERIELWATWPEQIDSGEHPFVTNPLSMYAPASAAAAQLGAVACGRPAGPSWRLVAENPDNETLAWYSSLADVCATFVESSATIDDGAGATFRDNPADAVLSAYLRDVASTIDETLLAGLDELGEVANPWQQLIVAQWTSTIAATRDAALRGEMAEVRELHEQWRSLAGLSGIEPCARGFGVGSATITGAVGRTEIGAGISVFGTGTNIVGETPLFAERTLATYGTDPRFSGVDPTNSFALAALFEAVSSDFETTGPERAASPTTMSLAPAEPLRSTEPAGPANPWVVTTSLLGDDQRCVAVHMWGWPVLEDHLVEEVDVGVCSANNAVELRDIPLT